MSTSSSNVEALLQKCFSPIELYGFVIRCFGYELHVAAPELDRQNEIYASVTTAIAQSKNRFFYEEFRRYCPQYYEAIESLAAENELALHPMKFFPELPDYPLGEAILKLRHGRFWAMSQLKKDSMMQLYRGWDSHLHKDIKIHLVIEFDPETVDYFYEQLVVMSSLPHQNICNVFDVGFTTEDQLYIVSELGGVDIAFIRDESVAFERIHQLARALDAAHQRDLLHGPILDHHVHIDKSDQAVLGGFGEFLFTPDSVTESSDFQSIFQWLSRRWRGDSENIQGLILLANQEDFSCESYEDLLEFLTSDVTEEVVQESSKSIKPKGVMEVDAPEVIFMQSYIMSPQTTVGLRNVGDGLMHVHITTDQPWLKVIQERPEPRRLSQQIDIVFLHQQMKDVKGEANIYFAGPDGQSKTIKVVAKKAYWFVPAIIGFLAILLLVWLLKD